MLNKVLGEQSVKDIKALGDQLVFLRDTGKRGAGSLAADAIRTGQFTNPMVNLPKAARFRVLNYMFNNPRVMRTALEVKAGRKTPQAAAQSLTQALNESAAQVTGSGVPLTQRATGAVKGIGAAINAANRGNVAARQGGVRAIIADQEARGTPPPRMEIPEITQPMATDLQIQRTVDPRLIQQQMNLRERAKDNPYIASTLLGGLGNAGLL